MSEATGRNILLSLAYDGSRFHGWQAQPGLRTVQGELQMTLQRLLGHPISLVGASRTDAGVHALRQCANFRTSSPVPTENIARALPHRLAEDLALVHLAEAPPAFHATRDAISKLYRYRILRGGVAPAASQRFGLATHFWSALDVARMSEAAAALVGTHDFAGFASAGAPRLTTVRTIMHAGVTTRGAELRVDFIGDGFLYNQVRNMVGTLLEIARGRWPVTRIAEILAQRDRRLAGPTAPAHGLCLRWIRYGPIREEINHAT